MGNPKGVSDLLKERESEYGHAWLSTGEFLRDERRFRTSNLWYTPYGFAWLIILNKLERALITPSNADHWRDIEGYAKLVADRIDKGLDEGGMATP